MKYSAERSYPYILSIIFVGILIWKKVFLYDDPNYNNLLDGIVTLDSIIIGFLGAIIPVILSMKNESKFVKYVFEKDKKGLFSKYLKITFFSGIVSVVFSLAMYMQASMSALVLRAIYISWLFFTVLFIAATYRSMTNMIKLVFSKDDDLINDEAKDVKKTEIDEETIKKYS